MKKFSKISKNFQSSITINVHFPLIPFPTKKTKKFYQWKLFQISTTFLIKHKKGPLEQ